MTNIDPLLTRAGPDPLGMGAVSGPTRVSDSGLRALLLGYLDDQGVALAASATQGGRADAAAAPSQF